METDVERAPELAPVVKKYNELAAADGFPAANLKTGEHGRPFRLETLDGALIMERVLAPGTAVAMTLAANLKTKHGVPAVAEAGSSGSIVFRTITDRVAWSTLEKELAKFYTDKDKKRKAGEEK